MEEVIRSEADSAHCSRPFSWRSVAKIPAARRKEQRGCICGYCVEVKKRSLEGAGEQRSGVLKENLSREIGVSREVPWSSRGVQPQHQSYIGTESSSFQPFRITDTLYLAVFIFLNPRLAFLMDSVVPIDSDDPSSYYSIHIPMCTYMCCSSHDP
jgi:hypothetical protein